ncbi:SGNH hydrolase [Anaeromyces robustus]|uniref:SGNH hydrolase n=1 Tax=Anaeromyces robustus TaxID=1754192 RepID=A0A1Y1XRD9_9FUNG|nr:SGNH hydrolase [Anaeromyces robustus]|eukprot:ORX88310.1 SGNH hydrolase [Anaeromyces robustus]
MKTVKIDKKSTIVCFGDSLTYGHGADSKTESWPALLQNRVKIPVINAGRNDDTTTDGLERFDKDVLNNNPAVLVIDFGGNDIYYPKKRIPYSKIESNFREMLDKVNYDKTQVYIMRFYNNQMRFLDLFGRFDRMLKRLEKDYEVDIIWDAWKGAWGNKNCKYDMSHCNANGYKVMEQNIYDVMEPFLKENNILKK